MNLTKPTGSLISNLMVNSKQPEPVEGMPATICSYTDRHAATVIAVRRFKTGARAGQVREVTVQEDKAIRTDKNGMSEAQDYEYLRDPNGSIQTFKVDKHGRFGRLSLGHRSSYHDYSF